MIDAKIGELIDEYGTEIDKNDFRNFILDLVKECDADGINKAKGYFINALKRFAEFVESTKLL